MTEKRFTFDNKSLLKDNEFWLDGTVATICNAKEICDKLNELHDDLMDVRAENTGNKLFLKDIVEDLEKQAESKEPIIIRKEYVEWIKQNVVLDL